jgi:hypothetical protein
MNTSAIVMMVVAMLLVWGGLVAAILSLRHRSTPRADETRRDL